MILATYDCFQNNQRIQSYDLELWQDHGFVCSELGPKDGRLETAILALPWAHFLRPRYTATFIDWIRYEWHTLHEEIPQTPNDPTALIDGMMIAYLTMNESQRNIDRWVESREATIQKILRKIREVAVIG